jgi:hypothetical protein
MFQFCCTTMQSKCHMGRTCGGDAAPIGWNRRFAQPVPGAGGSTFVTCESTR